MYPNLNPAHAGTIQRKQPEHPAEKVALQLIQNIKAGEYSSQIYNFAADKEFSQDQQIELFRLLEKYIKNNDWHFLITQINVYEGADNSAEVIFESASGEYLTLFLGYLYDKNLWIVDAYEFPRMTFSKPDDMSYPEYIKSVINEIKTTSMPSIKKHKIGSEGSYYIE